MKPPMCFTARCARLVGVFLALCLWAVTFPVRADRMHTVREGETLASIARRYGVSVSDLRAHAGISNDRALRPGEVLTIPAKGVVYVRQGQTLSHIARAHHVSVEALAKANRLSPNAPLKVGQRLVLPGHEVNFDRDWGKPTEKGLVTLIDDHGQHVLVRMVDGEGRVSRKGLDTLAEFMRAAEHGARAPNPRLALLLAHISDHFGGRPIRIVSGFRDAGGYTSESSRHVKGRAVDIQVRGVPTQAVWELCRRLQGVGCGYYPRSVFAHVDVRAQRTQWVDWSGPGQKPRYGTLRGPTRNRQKRARIPYPRAIGEIPQTVDLLEDRGDDASLAVAVTRFDDRDADVLEDADIADSNEAEARRVCLADDAFTKNYRSTLLLNAKTAED